MARYINIEPYEIVGDSHCIEWRDGIDINHVYTKNIPTANVVGLEILNPEFGGKITKYYCPHCNRFKNGRQVGSYGDMGAILRNETVDYCRHCGSDIIPITEKFERLAIAKMLNEMKVVEGGKQ